jgi:cytochrome c556
MFKRIVAGMVMLLAGAAAGAQAPVEKAPETYVKLMRQIAPTAQGVAKKVEAKDHAGIAADAASLRALFAEVETFWKARKTEDAVKFAAAAQAAATEMETAAKAGNESGIQAARKTLTGQCQACHTAHRDKMADGSWGIK